MNFVYRGTLSQSDNLRDPLNKYGATYRILDKKVNAEACLNNLQNIR